MASTPIITFQDMCELLYSVFNPAVKPPTGRELIAAKNAVLTAYRELPQMHRWTCFKRRIPIQTDASYATGAIAYDHTGGTYERQLTLSSGVWPANAARGTIKIGDGLYDVETRYSDTVVTLSEVTNPGADVAAGTAFVWFRDSYTLPVDFRRVIAIGEPSTGWYSLEYLSPDQMHEYTTTESLGSTGRPGFYTIRNSQDYVGAMEIVFGRAPGAEYTYNMLYEASPRQLSVYKESTGAIDITGNAVAVTGTSTAFKSTHVGSIIRVTDSTTTEPTSVAGNADGTLNPYLAQRTIVSVASATSLTLDSAVSSSTLTGVKFVISDPLDIDPITLQSPLEALAMSSYARYQKRADANELDAVFRKKLVQAMEFDVRTSQVQSGQGREVFRNAWGDVSVR